MDLTAVKRSDGGKEQRGLIVTVEAGGDGR